MESPEKSNLRWMTRLERMSKGAMVLLICGIFVVVAVVDYATGYEISCTVFYLLAIGMATWYVGVPFGLVMSVLSAMCTSLANVLTGQKYHNQFAPYWNGAIVLSFYLIVVWLLRSVRATQDTLEQRVRERTANLTTELAERKRLEKEVLVISEREQQRIGRDIHDSLCQHLTGTALAEQFLVEKLSERGAPEVADADRVVGLIEDAISMARGMATGLSPIEAEGEGLITALTEWAAYCTARFKVACRFEHEEPVQVEDPVVATHLYRIVQEAVQNAVRHGRARKVNIRLALDGPLATLKISDDGSGLPVDGPIPQGTGLRNMKYRASMIGGSLTLGRGERGAVVTCSFPVGGGPQHPLP